MASRTRTHLAVTALVLVALTGCTPNGPPVLPDPSPTAPPLFDSDEEALAAAEDAYRAYLAVSVLISNDGGKSPERIDGFVSDDLKARAIETSQAMFEAGTRTEGEFRFDSASLQNYDDHGDGSADINIYVCTDVASVRIISAEGRDVTPERQERLPLELAFEVSGNSREFILTATDLWTGEDFCAA